MMSTPAVTVIVPFFNAERTIRALLHALRSQAATGQGDTEFVFVDNGSTDGGSRIVEEAAPPRSSLLTAEKRGVSAARNVGLAVARGEIVVCIDSDCVPSRRWLRELVAAFTNPDAHLAAGSLASFPPRTGAQRFAARYGMNDGRRMLDMALPFANGRNMAVRRRTAEEVGGWPEDMLQGDDIEFSTRVIARFAYAIVYCDRALVYHQDRESDEELWLQARGYGRGVALLYDRHPDRLNWGNKQRAARARTFTRRQIGSVVASVGDKVGFVSHDDSEFARYLAGWDRSFWEGFHDERRALALRAHK